MNDIASSMLLSRLMEKAKACSGTGDGPVTAEKILFSAIELLSGKDGPLKSEERKELEAFSNFLTSRGTDMTEVRDKLKQHIDNNAETGFFDLLYFQGKLKEAQVQANKQNLDSVPADLLLMCILQEPSTAIRSCLNIDGTKKGNGDDPAAQGAQAGSSLSSLEKMIEERRQAWKIAQKLIEEQQSQGSREEQPRAMPKEERQPADGGQTAAAPDQSREKISSLVDVVKNTREALLEKVFGQDNAVTVFTNGYFQGELVAMLDQHRSRPRATFLFAGPPGVGKTFLAETAAQVLKLPFKPFDMSEYSDHEAPVQLCGSDAVFKDSQPGVLTDFVSKNPKCILLFDEIEKAHLNVIHLFLQILDAGRLRDAKTRKEVSFADTIVIFTTNAGKQLYAESDTEDLSGLSRKVVLKALEKDINPNTKEPFFPAALCSRFASGNVVMLNFMSAHNLREIAKSVIAGQVGNLEKGMGIRTSIEEAVYTAILLSEGGSVDARMIRGRAQSFLNQELFELFRLIDSDKAKTDIGQVEQVRFTVQLPEDKPEIRALFETPEDTCALIFAPERDVEWCRQNQTACRILGTQSVEEAKQLLSKNDVEFVMLDLDLAHIENKDRFLNMEDIESAARDFLWFVRENHSQLPVYLLLRRDEDLNIEEQVSFRRIGVQGFISIEEGAEKFAATLREICERLHHRQSIVTLAKSNKLVSFETGQRLSEDGKVAEICLFDFEFGTAVDAEDSKNVLSSVSTPKVRFADVIGAEDAKKELTYFVKYLQNPKKFMGTGVSVPKGILLYGPPGTGKTMLAKAMACEAGVTFLAAEGNQFLKKYVGEGPQAVHDLFRAARKYAPSILFVDEIDAIAKQRTGSEQSEAREEILTAFLTEMDGFKVDVTKPVFVLGATNFDVEPGQKTSLDAALMRRFDRRICVDLPNKEERIRFLQMQFAKKPAFRVSEQMLENLAVRSTGMSLAALQSVLELSLRMAVRDGSLTVSDECIEEAFETFNSGEVKKWDPSELERTARHEAGHALLSWLSGDKPSYLTIVARSSHGGYMQHGDNESKGMYTKEDMLARIRTALGGRAAELVYYGSEDGVSTGASGDLQNATRMAKSMICTYGMDAHFGLAVIDPQDANTPEIRQAVNKILAAQMEKAIALITENRAKMDALVKALTDNNSLTGEEIDAVLSQA